MENKILKYNGDYNSYLSQAISSSFNGGMVMLNDVVESLHKNEIDENFNNLVDKEYITSPLIGKYNIGDDKKEFYMLSAIKYISRNKIKSKIELDEPFYFKIIKELFNLKKNELRYVERMLFNTDIFPAFIQEEEESEISILLLGNVIEVKNSECI